MISTNAYLNLQICNEAVDISSYVGDLLCLSSKLPRDLNRIYLCGFSTLLKSKHEV